MSSISLQAPNHQSPMHLQGSITLNGSKSISNRLLIIQSLCEQTFQIKNLSNAKDTVILQTLLTKIEDPLLDAGDAGTSYRFLTAMLALRGNNQFLIGSKRMCERPIGVLVNALNELGANVVYAGSVGFPPLNLKEHDAASWGCRVHMGAHVSSQFISALLLIGPLMPNGIELILEGKIISRPYIQMTLNLMDRFGILSVWNKNMIKVPPQNYTAIDCKVEADWSAASYFYSFAALSQESGLQLNGLYRDSVQGDAVVAELMTKFGIETTYNEQGVFIEKKGSIVDKFYHDFSDCPDLAQTFAVLCAAMNIEAELTGLDTLSIKETDRIAALYTELTKLGCHVVISSNSLIITKGIDNRCQKVQIDTYNDHRMAMSFAPLCLILEELVFDDKQVVSKSYPDFWNDLAAIGIVH